MTLKKKKMEAILLLTSSQWASLAAMAFCVFAIVVLYRTGHLYRTKMGRDNYLTLLKFMLAISLVGVGQGWAFYADGSPAQSVTKILMKAGIVGCIWAALCWSRTLKKKYNT